MHRRLHLAGRTCGATWEEANAMRYGELRRRARMRVRELDEAVGIPRPLDVN